MAKAAVPRAELDRGARVSMWRPVRCNVAAAKSVEHQMMAPSASPHEAVAELCRNLSPLAVGEDRFAIKVSDNVVHMFGGMLAAQALHCAQRTVDAGRRVNSVHSYFLRRGRPELPLEFVVSRDSDGRSFSARRVDVIQESKKVFTLICSFHVPDGDWESLEPLSETVAAPESLEDARTLRFGDAFHVLQDLPRVVGADEQAAPNRLWVRVVERLPADPDLHECLLLYISDMGTPWHFATPAEIEVGPSLDHSVWFHRPTSLDGWHYLGLEPVSAADSRGFYTGHVWTAEGRQVASLAQENLLRRVRRSAS